MTRKDTILIAVVINAGLLSILFITAMIYDTQNANESTEFITPIVVNKPIEPKITSSPDTVLVTSDEVDDMLKNYENETPQLIALETHSEFISEPIAIPVETTRVMTSDTAQGNYTEVRVKKGDMLDKIARAHGTTSSEIKSLNQLNSERLSIGQILKIPSPTIAARETSRPNEELTESADAVYYVVKQGDNPWKIAQQFHVSTDEILKLNHLNAEKARNLKIGDRLRVK